ncbi:MAG: AraC family transcriptional regulator [Agrobacterium albertimagni]|uniref:Putative AraC family transcriptional regulator n=1 Tax=Agrobacterium albertimagni AOL15 TaxID=1156935 RepID=K2QRB6_9HYPH|nr:AraC family transcriptional regulator [Agrobacterium albertimagni]EKF57552.1 putative AraC family transcriptional regulator [Agrobacterium albertimagni AOL15]
MADPLSEMVELLQPEGLRAKVVSGAGRWRVEREDYGQPFYCAMLEGSALLEVQGHAPITLRTGDFVLIPAAFGFTMSDMAGDQDDDVDPLTVTMLPGETRHGNPEGIVNARLLVGHFGFASPDSALLIRLLPQLVHLRNERRLTTLVQLVTEEALADRPVRGSILARLLEVMLLEALRSVAGEAAPLGVLRGLGDPRLSSTLRLLHAEPTKDWTVDEMAREAALSRSVFFDRFRRTIGVSPREYLIIWRMSLAKHLLMRRGDLGLQEVAERVGYRSASAFSTAFSRFVGMAPSAYAENATHRMSLAAVSDFGTV